MAEEHAPLAAPLCTEVSSAPIEDLREAMGTLHVNDAEAEIEASKVHWSERKTDYDTAEAGSSMESPPTSYSEENLNVAGWVSLQVRQVFLFASDLLCIWSKKSKEKEENLKMAKYNAEVAKDNAEVFRSLQKKYPDGFFLDERNVGPSGERLSIYGTDYRFRKYGLSSEKPFAKGGQAELFYAHATTDRDNHKEKDESYVMKVFEEGTPLKDLVSNLPPIILKAPPDLGTFWLSSNCNTIISARLLKSNGRFAFLMHRAWGDLRKLTDMRKKHVNKEALLFPEDVSIRMIYEIAEGMGQLHEIDTVHRDLKASNVLIYPPLDHCRDTNFDPTTVEAGKFQCEVADYECSGGVVGTGFWRAPEILLGLKNQDYLQKPKLFSKAADVYSFGMTCYEILSGDIPFEGWKKKDWDRVIGGERPILPNHTKPWMRDLVNRCWHGDPYERPTFKEITEILEALFYTSLETLGIVYREKVNRKLMIQCET